MFAFGFICGIAFVFLAAAFAVAMDKKKEGNENEKFIPDPNEVYIDDGEKWVRFVPDPDTSKK